MFHESFEKRFSWNLMLRYTIKVTLDEHFIKYSERKIPQCIFLLTWFFLEDLY